MVRRHPHIFGEGQAETAEEVKRNWEKIKKQEKGKNEQVSTFDNILRDLPALPRSYEQHKRASQVGLNGKKKKIS